MKYVIIKTAESEIQRVYPFVFPEQLTHSEVAKWVQRAVECEFERPCEVYSAGFCDITPFGAYSVERHGSESLGIASNPNQISTDERILNMPNAFQCIYMGEL